MRRRFAMILLAALAFMAACGAQTAPTAADEAVRTDAPVCPTGAFDQPVRTGSLQAAALDEVSGIAASRRNPGILWVHNDSGDRARVYAIDATGRLIGTYNLAGVDARDCEDIAVGPGPAPGKDYIYLGDIGDNAAARDHVAVYRVEEPEVEVSGKPSEAFIAPVTAIKLKYEDGARDAETVMVDPVTSDLFIISKRELRSRVYRASAQDIAGGGTVTLRLVARLPWGWATGGDISPSGTQVVVRGYASAAVWNRKPGTDFASTFKEKPVTIQLASEPQGEAICFSHDCKGCYTVSEGHNQPVYFYARRAGTTEP